MKRKILIFLICVFVSSFAVSCDLFGNKDTTLPITMPVFSTTENTGQTTTNATVTPTTTKDQTTTTTTTKTTTTTTTKTTTTEEQTTTVTTEQGTYYEVVFKNWDGTIITTLDVLKGENAVEPVAPTRAGNLNYIYEFTGWDKSFTNVQSDLIVNATFELKYDSDSDYSHENLLMLMVTMYGNTDEDFLEEEIAMMFTMTGAISEHELYDMMLIATTLMTGLQDFNDVTGISDLMTKVSALGLNREMVANLGFNMMIGVIQQEKEDYQEDLAYYEEQLSNKQVELTKTMAEIEAIDSEVSNYCNSLDTAYSTLCQTYYYQIKEIIEISTAIDRMRFNLYEYGIQDYEYNDLRDSFDLYYNYKYVEIDEVLADEMYQEYLDLLDEYNEEQKSYLSAIITTYELYKNVVITHNNTDFSALNVLDANDNNVQSVINNYLFQNWQDEFGEYRASFLTQYDFKLSIEEEIFNYNKTIESANKEILMMNGIQILMDDPQMETNVKLLIEMIYDGVIAMMAEVDQEMIDFIMTMMNTMYYYDDDYYDYEVEMSTGIASGMMMSMLSKEKVTHLANSLGDMILSFEGTITESEKTLIANMFKTVFPYMIIEKDMTETEVLALKTLVNSLTDYFLPMIFTTGDDLATFLSTLSVEKTQAIIELITIITMSEYEDQYLINIAQTLDIVFGDESLDLEAIAGMVFDLYSIINYGPSVEINSAMRLLLTNNINSIMVLASEINLMNASALTEIDFIVLDEFKFRVYSLVEGFDTGFINMPSDYSYVYDTQDFLDLINKMGFDGSIEEFKTMFQLSDEEDTYYLTRSLYNYVNSFMSIRNFIDIQNFFAGIEEFGLTESQTIDIGIVLMKKLVYDELNSSSNEEEYYQNMIDIYSNYLTQELNQMIYYEQEILDFINDNDPSFYDVSIEYWDIVKLLLQYSAEYNSLHEMLINKIDSGLIYDVENLLLNIIVLDEEDPNYATDLALLEAQYDNYLLQVGTFYEGYIEQLKAVYFAKAQSAEEMNDMNSTYFDTPYESILINIYNMALSSWEWYAQNYYDYNIQLLYYTDMLNNYTPPTNYELEALMDLLNNDPDLFKGFIVIILDDIQNITSTMSDDSFMEIYDLIFFMEAPHGTYSDFTSEDILALTQDLSSLLKLIGNSIDITDEASIDAVINAYVGYYADKLGLVGIEKDDFIIKLTTVIDKYRGYADDIFDQMVYFLDSLTIQKIDNIINYAHDVSSEKLNEIEMAVLGAKLFEELFDVPNLDLTVIINSYIEIRMDIENDFDYDSSLLKIEFASYYTEVSTLISELALVDLTNITPEDISLGVELIDRLQHFAMYFENPTLVLDGYLYAYDSSDFEELIYMIFNASETEVTQIITEITTLLDLPEEEAYYKVLGIAMVLRGFENVQSLSDVVKIYEGLRAMGLSNSDIASYGMTIFMKMVYPGLPEQFDTQDLIDQNAALDIQKQSVDGQLTDLETSMTNEISLLDSQIGVEALEIWNLYTDLADLIYEQELKIINFSLYHYFDENLFYNELVPAYKNQDYGYQDYLYQIYYLSDTEINFYHDLYYIYYSQFENDSDYALDKYSAFASSYGSLFDSSETILFYELLTNAFESYIDLTIQKAVLVSTVDNNLNLIREMEDNGLEIEVIYNYLSDINNVTTAEQVITIILDEFEVIKDSPSFFAIHNIVNNLRDNYKNYGFITTDLVDNIGHISTLLGVLGSTIDLSEKTIISVFLNGVISEYVGTKDLDSTAEAEMIAEYGSVVATYMPMLFTIPDKLSSFLQTMDEAKIHQVISIITMMDYTRYSSNEELQRMALTGMLIDTIFGDDSLDYDYFVTQIYGLVFDVSDIEQTPIGVDKLTEITEIINSIDGLLAQASLVADIGIFGIDSQDTIVLDSFIELFNLIFSIGQEVN